MLKKCGHVKAIYTILGKFSDGQFYYYAEICICGTLIAFRIAKQFGDRPLAASVSLLPKERRYWSMR